MAKDAMKSYPAAADDYNRVLEYARNNHRDDFKEAYTL